MNERKELGKIEKCTFGFGGYQDRSIGLHITLSMGNSKSSTSKAAWDANRVKPNENSSWTEADRNQYYAEIVRYISDLLAAAKVESVDQLEGVPIEITFNGLMLKKWRILTEVL